MFRANPHSGVASSVTTNTVSFGEAHSGLTAIIPRVRPVLLLKKQADQVRYFNVRLSYVGRPPGPSPHRRHDVFGAGADAGGPAGGHRLEAGVEAHAFGAVDRHVAEEGALPAAKAVERH